MRTYRNRRDTLVKRTSIQAALLVRRVAFLSAHWRREIQGVSLRARLCRSVRREIFPPREAVAERPVLFIERGESSDDIICIVHACQAAQNFGSAIPHPPPASGSRRQAH